MRCLLWFNAHTPPVSVEDADPDSQRASSCGVLVRWKGGEALLGYFYEVSHPVHGASTLPTSSPPKTHILIPWSQVVGFQDMNVGAGHKHSDHSPDISSYH